MTDTTRRRTQWWALIVLLLLGSTCVALGQGRWPIPLAALLAPILLIRFIHRAPAWIGILGLTIFHAAAWEFAYLGMIKMPVLPRWGLLAGLSFAIGVVYLADRWVSRRSVSFWTTLVFPSGWVAYEYRNGRFSPSGSWASISYTFTDQRAIVQIASVVGWTGITFLLGWVAAVVNWVWRSDMPERKTWRGACACATVVLVVLVFGSVRLWSLPAGETVRVASIVGPSSFRYEGAFQQDVWAYTRGRNISDEQIAAARAQIKRTMDRHMMLAERELRAGAKLVAFPEANPAITKAEEPAYIEEAAKLASEFDAYIGLGLFVYRPGVGLPAENKYVLVGPDGSVVWDYLKSKLVPGSSHVVGEGILPNVETSFGRLSCAICFDMDFPVLLQQVGDTGTDILLAPSHDWTEVRTMHARMAVMRSVEQGCAIVRPTKDGLSLVSDALGRTLAWQDTNPRGDHALVANVPTSGIRTIYSVIGDAFSWTCAGGFLVLVAFAAVQSRQSRGDVQS